MERTIYQKFCKFVIKKWYTCFNRMCHRITIFIAQQRGNAVLNQICSLPFSNVTTRSEIATPVSIFSLKHRLTYAPGQRLKFDEGGWKVSFCITPGPQRHTPFV